MREQAKSAFEPPEKCHKSVASTPPGGTRGHDPHASAAPLPTKFKNSPEMSPARRFVSFGARRIRQSSQKGPIPADSRALSVRATTLPALQRYGSEYECNLQPVVHAGRRDGPPMQAGYLPSDGESNARRAARPHMETVEQVRELRRVGHVPVVPDLQT